EILTGDDKQFDELLAKAKRGSQQALLELVLLHQPVLHQFINKQLGTHLSNLVTEEDILQETFVQALKSIENFEGVKTVAFTAWLKAIATNRIRDIARKASAAKRGGGMKQVVKDRAAYETRAFDLIEQLSGDGFTPSVFAARREALSAMQAALIVLPEDQRLAIQYHCLEKLSLEETAAKMGRSSDSVRGLLQRGKQALKRSMQNSSRWFTNH
ncbi:MAG: sigma-70 family RNA polymerase sigma factor, partial [Planctomycetota bacterium]